MTTMPTALRTGAAGLATLAAAALLAAAAGAGSASTPPVGPLPPGPTTTIATQKGELVALSLPRRSNGRVWRVARPFSDRIVAEVAEADVGSAVVLVFKAKGVGTTTVVLALTRGETAKAYESRRFVIRVR
jgi:hypothetical protein